MNLIISRQEDGLIREALNTAFARRRPAENTCQFLLDDAETVNNMRYRLRNFTEPYERVLYVVSRLTDTDLLRFSVVRNLTKQLSLPMLLFSPISVLARTLESSRFREVVGSVEELIARHYTFSAAPFLDAAELALSCENIVTHIDSGWYGRFEWLAPSQRFIGCGRIYSEG